MNGCRYSNICQSFHAVIDPAFGNIGSRLHGYYCVRIPFHTHGGGDDPGRIRDFFFSVSRPSGAPVAGHCDTIVTFYGHSQSTPHRTADTGQFSLCCVLLCHRLTLFSAEYILQRSFPPFPLLRIHGLPVHGRGAHCRRRRLWGYCTPDSLPLPVLRSCRPYLLLSLWSVRSPGSARRITTEYHREHPIRNRESVFHYHPLS